VPRFQRAAVTAVLMIAGRGVLHAGDQLLVQHYGEELAPDPDPIEDAESVNIKIATSITVDLIDMFGER
jgi:hypothetical protein